MTDQPARYERGQRVELEISDLAEGDECFGRLPDGFSIFVRGPAAVGDRVTVELQRVKRSYAHGVLRGLLSPSPHRVLPPCEHFGVCGGCKWQHLDYQEQLRLKRKRAVEAFARIGGFPEAPCREIVPAREIFHYRNKLEFSFSNRRFLAPAEMESSDHRKPLDFALGFHAPRNFEKVVDIDRCHLGREEMNALLDATRTFCRDRGCSIYSTRTHQGFLRHLVVRSAASTGEILVNLVTSSHEPDLMRELGDALQNACGGQLTTMVNNVTSRKNAAAIGDREHLVFGPGYIVEQVDGFGFRLSAQSFFQTNTYQAELLYLKALEVAALQPQETAYDLYCGIGVIALLLSRRCREVVGVEVMENAVRDAVENAKRNGVRNCRFLQMDMKDLGSLPSGSVAPDVVVIDPPRAGLHPKAVPAVLNLSPRKVVYVSCNPATQARDVAMLCEGGRYRLDEVVPVDMFPHTNHVETIARLTRCG